MENTLSYFIENGTILCKSEKKIRTKIIKAYPLLFLGVSIFVTEFYD